MGSILFEEKLNYEYLEQIKDLEEFSKAVDYIRKYYRFLEPDQALELLDCAISRSEKLEDYHSLVDLYYTKQTLIFGRMDKLAEVGGIVSRMEKYSQEHNYFEGQALTSIVIWQVEKITGNNEEAKKANLHAYNLIEQIPEPNPLNYYSIKYSYAISKWNDDGEPSASVDLEECFNYFKSVRMITSAAKTGSILGRIYYLQNNEEEQKCILKEVLGLVKDSHQLPSTEKANLHYCLGRLSLGVSLYSQAEMHFLTAVQLLKEVEKMGTYVYYYIYSLNMLARIYGEKGQFEELHEVFTEIQSFVAQPKIAKTIPKQVMRIMISSLTISMLYYALHMGLNFEGTEEKIIGLLDFSYSSVISSQMLGELLVYSGVDITNLQEINENYKESIKSHLQRVIDYLIELNQPQTEGYKERIDKAVTKLSAKETTVREEEKYFSDLLIAKLLLSTGNYEQFSSIMEKYVGAVEEIDNLALRIMAEAFSYIYAYLQGVNNEIIFEKLSKLEEECNQKGLVRLKEDIFLYKQIVRQDGIAHENKKRFQKTIYADLFDSYSEKQTKERFRVKENLR